MIIVFSFFFLWSIKNPLRGMYKNKPKSIANSHRIVLKSKSEIRNNAKFMGKLSSCMSSSTRRVFVFAFQSASGLPALEI